MAGTFCLFKIDPQVVRLLPNTLQCLNKPFIQVLKQDYGLRLVREIPINVVGDFVQICALSQSSSYKDLDSMINHISNIFIKKWDYLDQSDFSLLIAQVSVELKERNLNWVSKLSSIIQVVDQVVAIQLEKGVKNRPDIIADLINGNTACIKQILKNPKKIDEFSCQQFYKMIGKFKKLNKHNKIVDTYCCALQESHINQNEGIQALEKLLGFGFLTLQKLCLNFILWSERQYLFLNFAIGNGKTLLCSSLAVLLTLKHNKSTIIIGKSDYLVLRDGKRYQNMIASSKLNVNHNQFETKLGVYYMTQKYFENCCTDDSFLTQLAECIVVVDEYDWIMFDSTAQQMNDTIAYLQRALILVGLTGSQLSQKEEICLKVAFKQQEIKFPALNSLKGDKKIHCPDMLFTSSQQEYCKFIYELSMKQTILTPVVIVAGGTWQIIEAYFKKFRELQFYSIKSIKGSKTDAYLEGKFNVKNSNKRFGVYLLSELQGRGTDLQSSREIETNGGIYLIIADIFSKRSTNQIIGRVGRLENKGQWRQLIWQGGSQDTVEQAISIRQELLENEIHIKFSKLQTMLSQKNEEGKAQKPNVPEKSQQTDESIKQMQLSNQIKSLELREVLGDSEHDCNKNAIFEASQLQASQQDALPLAEINISTPSLQNSLNQNTDEYIQSLKDEEDHYQDKLETLSQQAQQLAEKVIRGCNVINNLNKRTEKLRDKNDKVNKRKFPDQCLDDDNPQLIKQHDMSKIEARVGIEMEMKRNKTNLLQKRVTRRSLKN